MPATALNGKKILLGITGSIAAYKSALLARLLIKAGAEVQVLMTEAAGHFIAPLTLATLTQRPVYSGITSGESWNNHVELGLWADAMVIAPITATTLAKLSQGLCDSIIAATYLSARCPVFFAPAMDLDMWKHPATQENVQRLQRFGNHLIPVGTGELASGLVGEGRMAEPEAIVARLANHFAAQQSLAGQHVLLTAGPTHEAIDPVRFIGNHSSGKMGIAIADELAKRGAAVSLVLGPASLGPSHSRVSVFKVQTALEMHEAALRIFPSCQAAILAAAVADYRPKNPASQKIKKQAEELQIELVKNPDIAQALGQQKQAHQRLIGFALETENAQANARGKLERKNLDLIVLNFLAEAGAGFQHDTNKVSFLWPGNKKQDFELKSKAEVACDIADALQALLLR